MKKSAEQNTIYDHLCEPVAQYSRSCRQLTLFNDTEALAGNDIRVIELFAGVGGFRIGLEPASDRVKTI
ncbi:MAG: hypothetical protein K2K22_04425, partial [Muribaculaceae bacterium]|nr:hypothetical protein [Muribaculaceae bacterium]